MGFNSEARRAQIQAFDELIKQSYDQLQSMPSERFLPLPEGARGSTVCVRKKMLDADEIEVEVVLRQRFLLLFHGMLRKSFRMNCPVRASDELISLLCRTFFHETSHSLLSK
jgi:hypothetical protein